MKKEITIYLRGVKTPICLAFDELIKDDDILNGFSPLQASYIGYYYGMYCYDLINKSQYPNVPFNCFKNIPTNTLTIHMLDRRRNLVYLDQISGIQDKGSPLQIMLDKNLISKFPPLQSCYIGVLAGITNARVDKQISNIKVHGFKLKIV